MRWACSGLAERRDVRARERGRVDPRMIGAMTAGASASGVRAWLGRHGFARLTPPRQRRITIALVAASLGLSSPISGSSAPSHHTPAVAAHAAR
jgi:hypothetical protein